MRIPGTGWLRRAARRLKNWWTPRGLILMYHRVAETDSDPWGMCVSPRHFGEHLGVLRKRGTCMQLQRLTQSLENGTLPRRPVAVTFDDGYADNFYQAQPLLERYGIPATLFLTTGYLGGRREFWWDELDRLLLQPETLPKTLQLTFGGRSREWTLGTVARYRAETRQRYRSWRAWEKAPTTRHALYAALWEQLYERPEEKRQKVLDKLRAWAGVSPVGRRTHRALSEKEAAALAQSALIDIGAHTMTHPALALLPAALQQREIRQSKQHLEQLLGRPVTSFSYPHGHYTTETVSLVRQAGFARACSTEGVPVLPSADRFQLPRVQVLDWDGEAFDRQLSAWQAAADEH